jgi:hypothetical protein
MHKARAFFFVCAGIFLLALSYHLRAHSASAQQGSQPLGLGVAVNHNDGCEDVFVITPNGDVFQRCGAAGWKSRGPAFIGNLWGDATPQGKAGQGQGDG